MWREAVEETTSFARRCQADQAAGRSPLRGTIAEDSLAVVFVAEASGGVARPAVSSPHVKSLSRSPTRGGEQVAVWRGTLIEELSDQQVADLRGRGGRLCAQAAERDRRWGSLRFSWLVKNCFEAWRVVMAKRLQTEKSRQDNWRDSQICELERLLAEKSRLIQQLEQQLGETSRQEFDIQSISNAVLELGVVTGHIKASISEINLEVDHTPVLDAIRRIPQEIGQHRVLDAIRGIHIPEPTDLRPLLEAINDVESHFKAHSNVLGQLGRRLDDLERGSADQTLLLKRLAETEDSVTANTLHQLFQDLRADIKRNSERMSAEVRQEVASVREEITTLRKRAMDESIVEAEWLTKELRDLKQAIERFSPKVDLSEVIGAIRQIKVVEQPDLTPLLSAVRRINPEPTMDLSPVLGAVKRLEDKVVEQPDLSPLLSAVRRINPEPTRDMSPVLGAVKRLEEEMVRRIGKIDLEPKLDRITSEILKATTASRVDLAPLLDAIERFNPKVDLSEVIGAIRRIKVVEQPDLTPLLSAIRRINPEPTTDLSPVLGAVKRLEEEIVTAIGKIDLEPVLRTVTEVDVDLGPVIQAVANGTRDVIDKFGSVTDLLERSTRVQVEQSEVLRTISHIHEGLREVRVVERAVPQVVKVPVQMPVNLPQVVERQVPVPQVVERNVLVTPATPRPQPSTGIAVTQQLLQPSMGAAVPQPSTITTVTETQHPGAVVWPAAQVATQTFPMQPVKGSRLGRTTDGLSRSMSVGLTPSGAISWGCPMSPSSAPGSPVRERPGLAESQQILHQRRTVMAGGQVSDTAVLEGAGPVRTMRVVSVGSSPERSRSQSREVPIGTRTLWMGRASSPT